MPSYDASRFDPPAPVASVTLRDPRTAAMVADVTLLVDTGADVSLLPRGAVERLGVAVAADDLYELVGFDGSRSLAPVVVLEVLFLRRAFRGRFLLTEETNGIMSRDILNHLMLLRDGPGRQWSEHIPSPR
jgi:hypothetical protein